MSATHARIETMPLDVVTMHDTACRLLEPDAAPDVLPFSADELGTLILQLRGHLQLLAPEVEQLALQLPQDSVPRYCALACVREVRGKLQASPLPGLSGAAAYGRRLARAVNALCEYYPKLRGVRLCPACEEPIADGEPSLPRDHPSPSGSAARSSDIHANCRNVVRLR
ncbi:DUF6415 family natural product biosynthesis protein [Streptomyces sp. Y7]|uniref:DUF6415 family natural product biosynthesis protein n=1 Tax=Streptomyces sp. Y7 TaxID=3342392 RepID=UPI003714B610